MRIGIKNFISNFEMIFATGFIMLGAVIYFLLFGYKIEVTSVSVQRTTIDTPETNIQRETWVKVRRPENPIYALRTGQHPKATITELDTGSDVPTQSTTSPISFVRNKLENGENKNYGEKHSDDEIQDEHEQENSNVSSAAGSLVTKNSRSLQANFDQSELKKIEDIQKMQIEITRFMQLSRDLIQRAQQLQFNFPENQPSNLQESEHSIIDGQRINLFPDSAQ